MALVNVFTAIFLPLGSALSTMVYKVYKLKKLKKVLIVAKSGLIQGNYFSVKYLIQLLLTNFMNDPFHPHF